MRLTSGSVSQVQHCEPRATGTCAASLTIYMEVHDLLKRAQNMLVERSPPKVMTTSKNAAVEAGALADCSCPFSLSPARNLVCEP